MSYLAKRHKENRNQTILKMRRDGYSLQSIGDKFGYSREWIRLILKEQLGTTDTFKFNPHKQCQQDEYSAPDLVDLTGYPIEYITTLIKKNWLPKASRILKTHMCHTTDTHFWKKTDIDRWIELKKKHLKIALEGFLNSRLNSRCPYKFTHPNLQKRYKLLVQLQSENWKGKLSYNSLRNDLVMKEFNNSIKPIKYIPTDYSKYLNMRSKEHFAEKGLYNSMETGKITGISFHTIHNFRKKGILKKGIHYFSGDHYLQRYMYDPAKTKQAIIDAGYDTKLAASQRRRWAKFKQN